MTVPLFAKKEIIMPTDPIILLSFVNTKLRDEYPSFEELCRAYDEDTEEISRILSEAGFKYDREKNSFGSF